FSDLPMGWRMRDFFHGWVEDIEKYEDRQKRSAAAKKAYERKATDQKRTERIKAKSRQEEKSEELQMALQESQAAPAKAEPAESEFLPLQRYDIRIPLLVELPDGLEAALAVRNSSDDFDRESFRLRHELAHLGLLQGFDELLCLPTLHGVETFWYQIETVRKVL